MHKDKLCLYDGATILIKDPLSINHIRNNPQRYGLKGTYDMSSGEELAQFEGKFRNFNIWTGGNRRGSGVFIGGSLHKWKNRTHNYDSFYWQEFVQVYNEVVNEFQFRPEL